MKKYENFCRALQNLKECQKYQEPYSTVTETGLVALFEICFEQAWKLMKQVLEEHGRFEEKIGSPRAIIKVAYQCGMLSDCEAWLELLEARNILAHTYSDEQSLSVIRKLKTDYLQMFFALKSELQGRWLCDEGEWKNG